MNLPSSLSKSPEVRQSKSYWRLQLLSLEAVPGRSDDGTVGERQMFKAKAVRNCDFHNLVNVITFLNFPHLYHDLLGFLSQLVTISTSLVHYECGIPNTSSVSNRGRLT